MRGRNSRMLKDRVKMKLTGDGDLPHLSESPNPCIWIQPLMFGIALGANGAVEKTRTSTPCGTATSTLRVYQFRHDRTW